MVSTANEALFAEMLLEAENLVKRLDAIKEDLPGAIEKGTLDGINSAMLAAKMSFEKLMKEESNNLKQRAQEAAQIIGQAQAGAFDSFLKTQKAVDSKGKSFIWICAGVSFAAALVGGLFGVKLAIMF